MVVDRLKRAWLVELVAAGGGGPQPPSPGASFRYAAEGERVPWTHERFDADDSRSAFALIADLTGDERARVFEIAVAQLALLRPELIVSVGDLIEGDSDDPRELAAEWDWFDERAHRARAPFFYAGGNHDLTGEWTGGRGR